MACLIGYGAAAVNPYLMFESLYALHRDGRLPEGMDPDEAVLRVIKAVGKGLMKILSKMGISTIRRYTGAQIFEAVGLEREVIDRYFTGTVSRVGGVGLNVLAWEALDRHRRAYPAASSELLPGGRHLRVAARRRVPRLEPGDDRRRSSRSRATTAAPTPTSASPRT